MHHLRKYYSSGRSLPTTPPPASTLHRTPPGPTSTARPSSEAHSAETTRAQCQWSWPLAPKLPLHLGASPFTRLLALAERGGAVGVNTGCGCTFNGPARPIDALIVGRMGRLGAGAARLISLPMVVAFFSPWQQYCGVIACAARVRAVWVTQCGDYASEMSESSHTLHDRCGQIGARYEA